MIYREFGKTGLKLSALGFGSMRLPMVDIGGEEFVDLDKAVDCIRYGLDQGINYIDSGFLYCALESEIAVGRALRGRRDKVTVATKATKFRMKNPGDLRRMLEHSLQKMELDYFDFYCFHGIGWENFHEIDEKTGWLKEMFQAKDEGLLRRIGFSFHDEPDNMRKIVDLGFFEMVTCQYNYLDTKNEEAMAYASEQGLGVVVMGPVGGGRLAGLPKPIADELGISTEFTAELPLKFVLANPNVNIALSGMGSRRMVDENVAVAASGEALSDDERARLGQLMQKCAKMADLYCTGCGYCMPCEHGVNIPRRFELMNFHRVYGLEDYARQQYALLREDEATKEGGGECIECRECEGKCPQHVPVVDQLKEAEEALGA